MESGYGRSDLIILDPGRNRSLVLELKHVDEEKKMFKVLGEACSQLIREKYGSFLVYHGYNTRLNYACAFWDKKALIKACMEK